MSVSINKWLAALAALVPVLGTVGPVSGEIVIDRNTTIDSTVREEVHVVEGTNPNPPTVVEIVEPAHLDLMVEVFDSSVVNMHGGVITDDLTAWDSSVVNVWGGRVGSEDYLRAGDSSTVNVFGGEIWDDLNAGDSSTVNISGGRISEDVYADDSSTVNISGGRILDDLWAAGSSTVNVFDGQLDGGADARDAGRLSISGGLIESLRAGQSSGEHTAIITIAGSGFNFPYGAIADRSGTLTGTLAGGDRIDAPFEIYSDASIVLIPEPSTFVLLTMGAAGLALCVRRRRRHRRSKMERSMFSVAVLLVLAGTGCVQAASFTPLVFPGAEPSGVSNNAVVVGSTSEPRAFRWTEADGMTRLPGGETGSYARGVSADGSVVVGLRSREPFGREAFRWTQSEGMVALETEADYAYASAVSADGSAVVGNVLYGGGLRGNQACVWTQSAGLLHLGYVGSDYYSHAKDVSADGSVVVGDSVDPGAHAFRWTQSAGMDVLPGGIQVGRAVSADGSVVVGEGYLGSRSHAFRWTQGTGSVDLGQLAGEPPERSYYPRDVSGDGSIVVGLSAIGVISEVAFIWDPDHGMRRLEDVLTVDYGLDLGGMNLTRATAISDNGLHVVGLGEYTNGVHAAWIATIPEPSSLVLAIVGLIGLLAYAWRRQIALLSYRCVPPVGAGSWPTLPSRSRAGRFAIQGSSGGLGVHAGGSMFN